MMVIEDRNAENEMKVKGYKTSATQEREEGFCFILYFSSFLDSIAQCGE
jgi:hypothetical protein